MPWQLHSHGIKSNLSLMPLLICTIPYAISITIVIEKKLNIKNGVYIVKLNI
jgi:hypothetical protein